MMGGAPRRDSWDAIAKTKSMLSYGSLESLANLANSSSVLDHTTSGSNFNNSRNTHNTYGSSSNVIHTENSSTNYTSSHRFTTADHASPKYNGSENTNGRGNATHGILKNKNNNYYKTVDATDAVHERFATNGGTAYSSVQSSDKRKGTSLITGSALEMLPIHKPMSFTIDPSIDASKATVTITGKNSFEFFSITFYIFHFGSEIIIILIILIIIIRSEWQTCTLSKIDTSRTNVHCNSRWSRRVHYSDNGQWTAR